MADLPQLEESIVGLSLFEAAQLVEEVWNRGLEFRSSGGPGDGGRWRWSGGGCSSGGRKD